MLHIGEIVQYLSFSIYLISLRPESYFLDCCQDNIKNIFLPYSCRVCILGAKDGIVEKYIEAFISTFLCFLNKNKSLPLSSERYSMDETINFFPIKYGVYEKNIFTFPLK